MPFQKGQIANPTGRYNKQANQFMKKTRTAMNMAVDGLGDASVNGATAMSVLITAALREDIVGTLKALSVYMPKELNVDVQHSANALQLTDEQLLEIIKSRSLPAEKVVEGQLIEQEPEDKHDW